MSAFKTWLTGLTSKATPVDADELYLRDSVGAASNKLTWANAKATMKAYFDTVYDATGAASGSMSTHVGAADPHTQYALESGLGDAAAKNTGTTAGTVAAGDDSRLSDARVPTAAGLASTTNAAASKTTPVDADEVPLADSAATYGLKKLTWASVKATLKTYFDSFYAPRAVTILLPATNDEVTLFRAKSAMTLTKMTAIGGGFTYTVRKAADRSATGTEVVTGGSAVNSTTTGDAVTSFSSASIAAGDYVWLVLTSVTGTPASFNLTMEF